MSDTLTLRCSISSRLIWATLVRGSLFAGCGALIIIYAGSQISVDHLTTWGGPAFVLGLTLIAIGLVPYRRLVARALKPSELRLNMEVCTFADAGCVRFSLPYVSVERVVHSEGGLACWLKDPIPEAICVHDEYFQMQRFIKRSQKQHGCDLYFPNFSEAACDEFKEVLEGAKNPD